MHVLAARIGAVDGRRVRRCMPPVDGGVVLHTGIGALPGRLGEGAEQLTGLHRFHHQAGFDGPEIPVLVLDHRFHELVGDPHRVVGVLILDGKGVFTVEIHVKAGVSEHARLAFFEHLALDEVGDVGMIHVEHHHLGGPSSFATGLDGAGGGVSATHEAHRARCSTAALQLLLRGTDT